MNKKLLLTLSVLAATGAMALAGCNKGSSTGTGTDTAPTGDTSTGTDTTPSVDPISEIEYTAPDFEIVVGDVIDLDLYFNVVGGTDPKGFTVELSAATGDAASLEGHVLTVLKEGTIAFRVSAGDELVRVEWEALSRLKANFKSFSQAAAAEYALTDTEIEADGTAKLTGTGLKHNENYFYSYTYDSTAKANVGSGMIRLSDGNMYDFSADDLAGTNFAVAQGGQSAANWDLYFVNMGNPFDYSSFETVTDEEGYTTLVCDASVEAPSGMEDYAVNMPAYMLLCGYGYRMNYSNVKQDSLAVVIEETSEADVFLVEFTFEYTDSIIKRYPQYAGTQYGEISFLEGPEASKLAPAEAYLEAGTIPEALTFDELTSAFTAMDTAKNYTVDVTAGWFNAPSIEGTPVTNPLTSYGYQDFVPAATDSKKVTEVGYAGEAAAIVSALDTYLPSYKEVGEDGSVEFGIAGDTAEDFITAVYDAAGTIGKTLNNYVPQLWDYGNTMFDGYVVVSATGEVEFDVGFTWSTGVYYRVNIYFSAVGTTTL